MLRVGLTKAEGKNALGGGAQAGSKRINISFVKQIYIKGRVNILG
jgi:hypothetical protein